MSLPEISRRCLSCGASVRAGARFCPQCGEGVEQKEAPPPAAAGSHESQPPPPEPPAAQGRREDRTPPAEPPAAADNAPAQAAAGDDPHFKAADDDDDLHLKEEWERWQQTVRERHRLREQEQGDGADTPHRAAGAAETHARPADAGATPAAGTAGAPEREAGAAQPEAGARWRRAADAAAAVGEGVRPRVERLRDASVYVLEEPPDDSGLSFVLIAAALFLLFLLFLFLSTALK